MKKQFWEEILIALSLANLLFMSGWRLLIFPNSYNYITKEFPSSYDHVSIIFLVLFLSSIFIVTIWLSRCSNRGKVPLIVKCVFLLVILCVVNVFRVVFAEYETLLIYYIGGRSFYLISLGILGAIGFVVTVKWFDLVFKAARGLTLVLFPFVLFTFLQAVIATVDSYNNPKKSSDITYIGSNESREESNSKIKSRIVWIIFDEMDYRMAFELRPKGVKLDEFDRMRRESLFATQATSPARDTLEAIPSLIIGKRVVRSIPDGASELVLNLASKNEAKKFSESPNIFESVKGLNGNTAVIGFYHSYCRVLKQYLSSCFWSGRNEHSDSLAKAFRKRLKSIVESLPGGYRIVKKLQKSGTKTLTNKSTTNFSVAIDKAIEQARNPEMDMVFIHLPLPHPPYFFNERVKEINEGRSYFGNLNLADEVLGKIRKSMEKYGLWDNSTVIVSSDHPWRIKDHMAKLTSEEMKITEGKEGKRIPFILKLKNQKKSIEFDEPFNTVITNELILSIVNGNISTVEEANKWVTKR